MHAPGKAEIDLIVLDLRLPQGERRALLRAIRKMDQDRPPVVVFSGTIASAARSASSTTLGVAGYVNEYTAVQHIVPSLAPHLFPDSSNRRSGPRVVLGVPVAYRFGNTIAAALTLNISRGGLAVRTTSPLEVGTAVKVRFRMPTGKNDIDAEATHRVDRPPRRHGAAVHESDRRRQAAHRRRTFRRISFRIAKRDVRAG